MIELGMERKKALYRWRGGRGCVVVVAIASLMSMIGGWKQGVVHGQLDDSHGQRFEDPTLA